MASTSPGRSSAASATTVTSGWPGVTWWVTWTLDLFRGAKLRLVDVDPALIERALRSGHKLVARIRLTDARGNPVCARVHPPYLTWSVTAFLPLPAG